MLHANTALTWAEDCLGDLARSLSGEALSRPEVKISTLEYALIGVKKVLPNYRPSSFRHQCYRRVHTILRILEELADQHAEYLPHLAHLINIVMDMMGKRADACLSA